MRLKWSVAVAGTHGKTTTTSMVASLLDGGGFDPTVINGGIINAYGTNARLGDSEWMVVEADESDGTFIKLPATVAVVTNIDPEHMDFYGTFDRLRNAFRTFVENIPFYGFAAVCVDHPEVQAMMAKVADRRVIPYGLSPQAMVRAVELENTERGTRFQVAINDPDNGENRRLHGMEIPMYGDYNVQNALAAISVALELKVPDDTIREALAGFGGVKRRFTRAGDSGGVTVIDDYGHHPVEISAVLSAARRATKRNVVAVVQPHRYTRLANLFEGFCTCFNDADVVIVADVYTAGETPIEGASRDDLVEGLRRHGHRHVHALSGPEALAELVLENTQAGDLVVCLGAGSITHWAHALPGEMDRRRAGAETEGGTS